VAKLSKWGEGYFFTQRGAQRFLAEVSRIGINAHSDMWIMKNLDPVRWELKYSFVQDRQVGDMPESSAAGLHKNRRTNSTLKNARLAIMGDSHALFAGPRLGDLSANHPQEQHFPKASKGRLLDLLLQPSFPRQSSGSGSSSSVKAGNMTRTDQTAETTENQATTTQTMQGIFLSRADVNFTQVVERWRKREADMLPSDTLHTFVFTSTPPATDLGSFVTSVWDLGAELHNLVHTSIRLNPAESEQQSAQKKNDGCMAFATRLLTALKLPLEMLSLVGFWRDTDHVHKNNGQSGTPARTHTAPNPKWEPPLLGQAQTLADAAFSAQALLLMASAVACNAPYIALLRHPPPQTASNCRRTMGSTVSLGRPLGLDHLPSKPATYSSSRSAHWPASLRPQLLDLVGIARKQEDLFFDDSALRPKSNPRKRHTSRDSHRHSYSPEGTATTAATAPASFVFSARLELEVEGSSDGNNRIRRSSNSSSSSRSSSGGDGIRSLTGGLLLSRQAAITLLERAYSRNSGLDGPFLSWALKNLPKTVHWNILDTGVGAGRRTGASADCLRASADGTMACTLLSPSPSYLFSFPRFPFFLTQQPFPSDNPTLRHLSVFPSNLNPNPDPNLRSYLFSATHLHFANKSDWRRHK
jgi:hypothetical protein